MTTTSEQRTPRYSDLTQSERWEYSAARRAEEQAGQQPLAVMAPEELTSFRIESGFDVSPPPAKTGDLERIAEQMADALRAYQATHKYQGTESYDGILGQSALDAYDQLTQTKEKEPC